LTGELVKMLAEHQASQPEGCPYVFIPVSRYGHIQERRKVGTWTVEDGRAPLDNFCDHFDRIRALASIGEGTFHDLRRTCLSNWLAQGLGEFEVMRLAGHAQFETTRQFYLAGETGCD
jgi:integrase